MDWLPRLWHSLAQKNQSRAQRSAKPCPNERGNIALPFALSAAALLMMGVGAVQLAAISNGKSKYQSAADSAALAAVANNNAPEIMKATAKAAFLANLSEVERKAVTRLEVTVETGRVRSAVVSFAANQGTVVPGLIGGDYTEISGTARARKADFRYVNIDLWLDGSASMGVAADEAGRDKLRWLSRNDPWGNQNCAFACHLSNGPFLYDNYYQTSEQRAHANGVKLRHDIMKESIQILIDELYDAYPRGLRPSYAVARMSTIWERLLPYTPDMQKARDFVGTFQLTPSHVGARSRLTPSIQTGSTTLTYGIGDGSQANPEKVIIIVSDGMQFDVNSVPPGPIGTAACDNLKSKGYRVAVVQLKYVRLDGDVSFDYWVKSVYDQLSPALKACATPGYYFHADDPDEVRAAFRQLAKTLEESLRVSE